MAHASASRSLLGLARGFRRLNIGDPLTQCLAPRLSRGFAAETQLPLAELASEASPVSTSTPAVRTAPTTTSTLSLTAFESPVLATLYSFPSLEPARYAVYHPQFLDVGLRRDILHRAVIYEADGSRQGTASTKWRADVHGSNRKILRQKGTGRARAGDKKSPIRRGGGVAFGPHPRDFSTELPEKVYGQAFRIALSYRYRKGELVILDNEVSISPDQSGRWLDSIFRENKWGKPDGRSLIVTKPRSPLNEAFFVQMATIGEHGAVKDIYDVDVKDLLETGRIVIEKDALVQLLKRHAYGLPPSALQNMVRYPEQIL